MKIYCLIVSHPQRVDYAYRSIKNQMIVPDEVDIVECLFNRNKSTSENLTDIYRAKVKDCNLDDFMIILGDFEIPCEFVRNAVKYMTHTDIYGIPFLDQKAGRIVSGLAVENNSLIYRDFESSQDVCPDNALYMQTKTAKKYQWTVETSFGSQDHFYPFYEQAVKDNAKVFIDKTLVGIHHKL